MNDCNPMIGRALAFSHTGFGRLLGHRLVGEKTQPNLPAALDEASHRHAAGFDLPVGDPAGLKHLETVVAESKLASAPGFSGHTSALLLAVLHFFRHQHKLALSD